MIKKNNQIKKVGITGSSGNIGNTLQAGLHKKYKQFLFDITENFLISDAPFTKIDLAQKEQLKGKFDGLDAIIHLAGNPESHAPEQDTYRNNFEATSFVFEEARQAGVKKIVYASSNFYHEASITEEIINPKKHLITLGMAPNPICLYGQSKVYGEHLGRHLAYLGMQFVALRIGWTVPEDNPTLYHSDYMRAIFCSKRDLVQAFNKALEVETTFMAAFAVSDNTKTVFDLTETKRKLNFIPKDNAENYL